MHKWIVAITGGLMLAAIGCAPAHDRAIAGDARFERPGQGRGADFAAALLFDRKPGRYHASEFAVRSDWPSTDSFYSPGQVIFFTERFVDFQGRGLDESDYTYRRFDTRRSGIGYR